MQLTEKEIRFITLLRKSDIFNPLFSALEIRVDRKKLYQNAWLKDSYNDILVILKNKIGRLEIQLNNKLKKSNYENASDNVFDIINYAAFIGEKLNREKK